MNQNSPDKKNIFGGLLLKGLKRKVAFRVLLVVLTIILAAILMFSLTAAWQINVVQTSGLSFSAESWNFSGEVLLDELNVVMTPGDTGVIPLTLKNDSQSLVAASITVSKAQMSLENDARNRIFFYVDTQLTRNGEILDKVYISSKKSYTYTIFPFSELVIGENSRNQARLHWEWVYDNLGYYILGYSTDNGGVVTEDYLQPITYNYDELLTTFDDHGNLLTIDGSITADEFLEAFSANDGYSGIIDVDKKTAAGYYPVSVDDSGYGVWAYLCTYSEIQKGISDDTSWGNTNVSFGNVNFMIVGQNSREEGYPVYDEKTLIEALSTPGVRMVTLNGDITLTQSIVCDALSTIMIDMNGKTISSTANPIVDLQSGGQILLYNGSIDGLTQTNEVVRTIGGRVTLQKVNISNVSDGIVIRDFKDSNLLTSSVHLIDCNISTLYDGLWIHGNGGKTDELTEVVIENCKLESEIDYGINTNGSNYGTDIYITGSEIKGKHAAIYFPQKDSYLTIDNSTLTGANGLFVKGGYINIIDSVITGEGNAYIPTDPDSLSNSGVNSTGDGVYLEGNYIDRTTLITISGSKTVITSKDQVNGTVAVRQFPIPDEDGRYSQAKIIITGGTYSTDVSAFLEEGYVCTPQDNVYVVTKANA